MADELIDIFDENNNSLNIQRMKSEAHKKGLWHRAAHVWIYNSKGEILLQLRSKDKAIFPNKWDVSVAGHVAANEEPITSALREIKEEIGIIVNVDDLKFHMIKKYQIVLGDIINKEFIYVHLLKYDGDVNSLKIHEEEVQKVQFSPAEFLEKNFLKHPEKYTPGKEYWMKIISTVKKNTKIRK